MSFRIAGTDGVSLEAQRWKEVLTSMGHKVTFVAGELESPGVLVPSLHFTHPEVYRVHQMVVENNIDYRKVEKEVFALAGAIEGELRQVLRENKFDRLIVANVFSLPIHFPLAVAMERVINEYKIYSIARNHDFWWERQRYLKSHCFEFFSRWFPPRSEYISHVTINSLAQKELEKRTGIKSQVIGDCFDFERKFDMGRYDTNWRAKLEISDKDIVFLQATRIIGRKQIELAMELVAKLGDGRIILVLAGYDGDEASRYLKRLKEMDRRLQIRTRYLGERVSVKLWDCFANCDLVTYPSAVEGFGNQFIETVYFRKPIFINRYPVFVRDIEPLGFETVAINGKVTERVVGRVRELLKAPEEIKRITEKNFDLGRKHFSYEAVRGKLEKLGL